MAKVNLTKSERDHRYYLRRQEELKERASKYYHANKGRIALVTATYRQTHKEQKQIADKVYRKINRETLKLKKAEYYQRTKARQVEHNRLTRQSDPAKHNRYSDMWRKRNPESRRASVRQNKINRKQAQGVCTSVQWKAKCDFWGWRCYLCRAPLTSATLHMEHRVPLSRGGSHWPANLAPACIKCNLAKNNKTEKEFRAMMSRLQFGETFDPQCRPQPL